VRRVGHPVSSYAGLTRVSILLRKSIFQRGWIAGSSPTVCTHLYRDRFDHEVRAGNTSLFNARIAHDFLALSTSRVI
jgi:hypothetical protein